MTIGLRRPRKVSKALNTKDLMFSPPDSQQSQSNVKEVNMAVDNANNFLQASAAKIGGTTQQRAPSTAPTILSNSPFRPSHDEADEINKLIAASAKKNSSALRDRRKTLSKELEEHEIPSASNSPATAPTSVALAIRNTSPVTLDPWLKEAANEAEEINKLIGAHRQNSRALKERRRTKSKEIDEDELPGSPELSPSKTPSSSRRSSPPRSFRNMTPSASPPKLSEPTSPNKSPTKLEAALSAVGLTADEPTEERSFSKQRWENAAVVVSAPVAADIVDESRAQAAAAAVYNLLSKDPDSQRGTQKLSGAAARGARSIAISQVREACVAVGGRFLSTDEWSAIKFETSQLRMQNKRLDSEMTELRKQLSEVLNGSKRGSSVLGSGWVSSVMAQTGSFIKTSPGSRAGSVLAPMGS